MYMLVCVIYVWHVLYMCVPCSCVECIADMYTCSCVVYANVLVCTCSYLFGMYVYVHEYAREWR